MHQVVFSGVLPKPGWERKRKRIEASLATEHPIRDTFFFDWNATRSKARSRPVVVGRRNVDVQAQLGLPPRHGADDETRPSSRRSDGRNHVQYPHADRIASTTTIDPQRPRIAF